MGLPKETASGNIAIVGLSPDNSYFNRENIADLCEFAEGNYDYFLIMVPFFPLRFNYMAKGKSTAEAISKADEKIGQLVRRIDPKFKDKIVMLDGNFYGMGTRAIEILEQMSLFFKNDLKTAVEKYLKGEGDVEIAKKYLHHELGFLVQSPFIEKSPFIKDANVTYIYKESWPILEDMIAGKYGDITKNLDFKVFQGR